MSHAVHGGRIEAAAQEFGRTDFLDFSANVNPFWRPADATEWSNWLDGISRYPEPDASLIRERLGTIYGVGPGRLLPTAGAIEGLYLVARLFTDRRVGIVEPAFADYARAFEAAGCEPSRVLLSPERWETPIPAWGKMLEPYEVIVLGRPNNPTGTLQGRDALVRAAGAPWAQAKTWIIDEAFIEFVPDHERESLLPLLERFPSVIAVRSLTKSWAIPGLRLGFVATANGGWLARLEKMQPPWSINAVAQAWARHQLTPAGWREMLESLRPLPVLRAELAAELGRLPGLRVHPGTANFLLVDVARTRRHASEIYRALGREGLLVRTGEGFYGLNADRYIRVAVRRPEENRRLVRALVTVLEDAPAGGGPALTATPAAAPASVRPVGPRRAKEMKALGVLGTSSNSGKSWVATALCAWLWRHGVKVAPFKAQNMSNNSYVTLDGGEIGRAQAAQAEACRLLPSVRMNPILLKPSGQLGSQLVVLGRARGHVKAGDYYAITDQLWTIVSDALEHWRRTCDVLVLEGAGSPVELNLATRDIVNLRPIRHLDGRWLLVSDIERGGVFAQIVGSWKLLSPADWAGALGVIVNKFRGDLSLFADAGKYLAPHIEAPYLGVLPYRADLQPESEDSLCGAAEEHGTGETIAWVRFPHSSNSQDCNAWSLDQGVRIRWVTKPDELAQAAAIVLPGSKNTIADLRWLRENGLAEAVTAAARRGVPVAGICGGYQMLGRQLADPEGAAGDAGDAPGLGLLPVQTRFCPEKEVRQVEAVWKDFSWAAYEIHMGRTDVPAGTEALLRVRNGAGWREEGIRCENVWGTYLHGVFESPVVRREFAALAGITNHRAAEMPWRTHLLRIYDGMADLLEEHLNLEGIRRYVEA